MQLIWRLSVLGLVFLTLSVVWFTFPTALPVKKAPPVKTLKKLVLPEAVPVLKLAEKVSLVKPVKVSVLTFHELSKKFEPGSLLTPVKAFEKMLRSLTSKGYQSFFLSQIPDLIEGRDVGLKKGCKPVVITFDDGYKNNYKLLLPLLKRYQMKANIFLIVSKIVEKRKASTGNTLTWTELSEMRDSGFFEFGSHTYDSHCNLPQKIRLSGGSASCWRGLYKDLKKARKVLKKRLGISVNTLAWPHGRNSSNLRKLARMTGHKLVFNTQFGTNEPGRSDYLNLRRISASSPFLSHVALLKRLWLAERGRGLDGRQMRLAANLGQL